MSTKTRISAIALSALIGASGVVGAAAATASSSVATGTDEVWQMCTDRSVNARSGPSTNYGVKRSYRAGKKLVIEGQAYGWSSQLQKKVMWYKVADGGWIRADFLDYC